MQPAMLEWIIVTRTWMAFNLSCNMGEREREGERTTNFFVSALEKATHYIFSDWLCRSCEKPIQLIILYTNFDKFDWVQYDSDIEC